MHSNVLAAQERINCTGTLSDRLILKKIDDYWSAVVTPLLPHILAAYSYSGKSGITHLGGSVSFFLRASSAISSMVSSEVSWMNFDACAANSLLGHLSPKIQPLTQSCAQFTVVSTVTSLLYSHNSQLTASSGLLVEMLLLLLTFTLQLVMLFFPIRVTSYEKKRRIGCKTPRIRYCFKYFLSQH